MNARAVVGDNEVSCLGMLGCGMPTSNRLEIYAIMKLRHLQLHEIVFFFFTRAYTDGIMDAGGYTIVNMRYHIDAHTMTCAFS